jgi:Uma2 family endonuclease
MSAAPSQPQFTPEDLLTMPDGDNYELVDGQLVERDVGARASYVAGQIHRSLDDFCSPHRLGWVFPGGVGYQCFQDVPSNVRRANVSFIHLDRLPVVQAHEEGHIHLAPDLAVEVIASNEFADEVHIKTQEFLAAGARLVWVVNPATRRVRVYRADGSVAELGETDDITGEDVLPGFRCRVGDWFRLPTAAGATTPSSA